MLETTLVCNVWGRRVSSSCLFSLPLAAFGTLPRLTCDETLSRVGGCVDRWVRGALLLVTLVGSLGIVTPWLSHRAKQRVRVAVSSLTIRWPGVLPVCLPGCGGTSTRCSAPSKWCLTTGQLDPFCL